MKAKVVEYLQIQNDYKSFVRCKRGGLTLEIGLLLKNDTTPSICFE